MARMTRAEKEALEAAKRKQKADAVKENWHRRVIKVLLELIKEPVYISTKEEQNSTWIQVQKLNESFWCDPSFPIDLPDNDAEVLAADYQLSVAEDVIDYFERERKETERLRNLKSNALAKLSAEEREVLGL